MKHMIATGALALAMLTGPAVAQEAAPDTSQIVEMTMGPEDAKVTIIEYASFTCPHCANFHKGPLKQLKAEYIDTDKVHFIYRDVYFDRFGLWASMVARCGGPEKFFGISDMIYEQQGEWTQGEPAAIADNLRRIGKVAGLEPDAVNGLSGLSANDQRAVDDSESRRSSPGVDAVIGQNPEVGPNINNQRSGDGMPRANPPGGVHQ